MDIAILIGILIIAVLLIIVLLKISKTEEGKDDTKLRDELLLFKDRLAQMDKKLEDEFRAGREENQKISLQNREELTKNLKSFEKQFAHNIKELNEALRQRFTDFGLQQAELNKRLMESLKEIKGMVEKQLGDIRTDNEKQLSEMRKTVDEKLQKTLNERLSQSFETVGKQLQSVQEGLGEMKNLAQDVGGLKDVLSNVKRRGGVGETQLEMLLEQILAPTQYDKNVKTKQSSNDNVEFAIKLPGKDPKQETVYLPIDAKFPQDNYEKLTKAWDKGDQAEIETAVKNFDNAVRKMAKDISEKYLDPPHTTDFGIMFLPFESLYAEVVRKPSLLEELQRKYKIIVTGPTTLAAILNSLQVGFRTLAIQKRSSEVWEVLSEVKTEFGNFGGLMQKAQKNIQTGMNQLDEVMGRRTRAIQRKLKNVSELGKDVDPKHIDITGHSTLAYEDEIEPEDEEE